MPKFSFLQWAARPRSRIRTPGSAPAATAASHDDVLVEARAAVAKELQPIHEKQLAEKDARIAELEARVAKLEQTVAAKDALLQEKTVAKAVVPAVTSEFDKPLLNAAQKGDFAEVEALLAKGADVKAVDKTNSYLEGMTPLHYAAMRGHSAIVDTLLAHGADVKVIAASAFFSSSACS